MTPPLVKVCGVRELSVLAAAIESGAGAIGLNFVPSSRRVIGVDQARSLVTWARERYAERPLWVGVFANAPLEEIAGIRRIVGLDLAQLHGHESPEDVAACQPGFKALRVGSPDDLDGIEQFPGPYVLIDARAPGHLGGTGRRIPVGLVTRATALRPILVAGGLNAENVAGVIATSRPAGVDTASGAEDDAGAPSADAARRFVEAAKRAFAHLREESKHA